MSGPRHSDTPGNSALEQVILPGNADDLPASARLGHEDCADAATALLHHRILAATGLEDKFGESIRTRFEAQFTKGIFTAGEVAEPAYRFRPVSLPFQIAPVTAGEYYRTEQRIKELCLRLASYGCLDGKYGLAMVAEAETGTDALIRYAHAARREVAPMDRDRLCAELPRLMAELPGLGQRLLCIKALWAALPPGQARALGTAGLLDAAKRLLAQHGDIDSLLQLTGRP